MGSVDICKSVGLKFKRSGKSNQVLYVIAGFLAGILFFPAIEALSSDASQLFSGFVPEAVGIAFTVLLIDRLYQRREEAQQKRLLQEKLVREAGSNINHVAVHATNELRAYGLLEQEHSVLKGAVFSGSNLTEANLSEVNLEGAYFEGVDLINTALFSTNLQGAKFLLCDLAGAALEGANLSDAVFKDTSLFGTFLANANLSRANLSNSYMGNAHLWETKFDENTILPDGLRWSTDIDMTRYTDPENPDFWEPIWWKENRKRKVQQ